MGTDADDAVVSEDPRDRDNGPEGEPEAAAAPKRDRPSPGDPNYNPLFDPRVKKSMDRLHSEKALAEKKVEELAVQLETLERKLRDKERSELSELERLKAENADLVRETERLRAEADRLNRVIEEERLKRLRVELAFREGIRPRHMKYVVGSTEEEILASIEEIKEDWDYAGAAEKERLRKEREERERQEEEKRRKEEERQKALKEKREVPTEKGLVRQTKETHLSAEEPVFTRDQIARMSNEEYAAHREAIKKALREGRIR
jgi:dTMP kinase